MTNRNHMTRADLNSVGAQSICLIRNGETVKYVHPDVLAEPGFYFLVKHNFLTSQSVVARFYVGRQRSKQGFNATLSHIRQGRSQLARTLASNNVTYEVLFVPIEKMKPLTTGFGKGQLKMLFTARHNEEYQNLQEMNRMLNDNFKFVLQSY